jgi:signal recognition particle receptor subunit beta
VPGQSYYEASRKIVLRGADGVVFVTDSDRRRMRANLLAWRNMREHLASFDLNMDRFPIVVQFNKRDLPTAVPTRIISHILQTNGTPAFEAEAVRGKGVLPTLKAITKQVMAQVQRELVNA